jgi:hypothetical protein
MEFATIEGIFGVITYSQNKKYSILRASSRDFKFTFIIVSEVESQKVLYRYQIEYSDTVAVSNLGYSAIIEKKTDDRDYDIIHCLDPRGGNIFKKKVFTNPVTPVFDNLSQYLVVPFFGSEEWVESYSIVWIDLKSKRLHKAVELPMEKAIDKFGFDADNNFCWF